MEKKNSIISTDIEQQFSELLSHIQNQRAATSRMVNEKVLQTAWNVGGYVSNKLKSQEWGSKVVTQFSEYVRTHDPMLKGFGRSNIYNMVKLYEEYSSSEFLNALKHFVPTKFVQSETAQIEAKEFVQPKTGQLQNTTFVQPEIGQMPGILKLITFSNHITILNACKSKEERLFYMLYAHKERLNKRELSRCIATNTFSLLLGKKENLSKGLLTQYPQAPLLFKDTVFVDFLDLPAKHSEKKLRDGILSHMRQFILELGKDFLFVDQEYQLQVGASTFKADLLFFHRGLQALVAIELKKSKFQPKDLGQLEFYLEALDRDVRRSNENPSIGILLCPEADRVVVEYAMSRSMSPTMVAEYKRLLIPKEKMQQLLDEYCSFLEINKNK